MKYDADVLGQGLDDVEDHGECHLSTTTTTITTTTDSPHPTLLLRRRRLDPGRLGGVLVDLRRRDVDELLLLPETKASTT